MYLTSYGAVREVTGSMHLLTANNSRILLDCGMFQGRRKESNAKNRAMPIDPRILTNVVLSHAHIDHCGRIPLLTNWNFHGRVIATRATVDACHYLLRDSAHIQESDAQYLNYKTVRHFLHEKKKSAKKKKLTNKEIQTIKTLLKKGPHRIKTDVVDQWIDRFHLKSIEPLYTTADAEDALEYFEGYPYEYPVTVGKDITCTFYEAGHILGAAMSLIKAVVKGTVYRILYTGDIGRFDKPIIRNPNTVFPEEDRTIDLLVMEGTYGDREHEPVKELKNELKKVITTTVERGGSIVIPSFAFGRTQEIIYLLHEIYNENEVPTLPIYIDSPLAVNLTRVFGEHPEIYDLLTHKTFLEIGQNPFMFDQIHFVKSVEESMELVNDKSPNIVISASGMCEAGRILHHLRYKIHNPQNTVLFVGYQAKHTLGRRIMEAGNNYEASGRQGTPPIMKFLNKTYPLHAHVDEIGGFSAHGDKNEMLRFLRESRLKIKRIALVHGEEDQLNPFQELLEAEGYKVMIPRSGEIIKV
ncbi:MAG: MBL fold metallo-hydrolase [Candidatus Aminicenantes bacterium]|nr:MBL fold metallo-hydrolase [Candidatus Aminicenantes bacterium]NIM82385.1 MBL fold metallo-hydrolase [Candidatus Aminicenantes bacterium]NIN21775.1 MBL fold metallo-hydrolase [Candidatus Aminicenantes bacterium]NIN42572.1 MBL fold metallo-hydrolase [Candidatus Aminicenantes bacterium]NIN85338.1 MBL fold metallo-hydrolase [Candidatus Aminicenantes bacterium]